MHEMSIKYLMSFKYLLIIRVVLFLKFLLLLYRHCNFEVQFYHIVYRIKFWLPRIPTWLWVEIVFCTLFTWSFLLTLYTPTSISIFSPLFSIHSQWYRFVLCFFTVCNDRPVRVIGRTGKRPEITVLTRRICLTIKDFFRWWSFCLFLWPWCLLQGWYCKEKLDVDASHS